MAKLQYGSNPTSVIIRAKLMDSTSTTGAGKTGLTHQSTNLYISTIKENELSATIYTASTSAIETITTLGTYAAPTANKCRFKEVDSTYHKGVYELQFSDARLSGTNVLLVSIGGVTGLAEADFEVECKRQNVNVVSTDSNVWVGTSAYNNFPQVTVSAINNSVISSATMNANVYQTQTNSVWNAINNSYITSGSTGYNLSLIPTISTNGVPSNFQATADQIVNGTRTAGSFSATWNDDGTYFQITTSGTSAMDVNLTFELGTTRVSQVTINGRFTAAASRFVNVFAYNYVTSAYVQISDSLTRMINNASDLNYTYNLVPNNRSDTGQVKIRFLAGQTTAGDNLFLDQVLVKGVAAGATPVDIANAVYTKMSYTVYDGAIWIDTINGQSGTDIGVHGIPTNPVNNLADAITLATSLGVKKFQVLPGSLITLTQSFESWIFEGNEYTIIGNNQNIGKCTINGATLQGTFLSNTGDFDLTHCEISATTLGNCDLHGCGLVNNFIMVSAGDYYLDQCYSQIAGNNTPSATFSTGANASFRHYSGGIFVSNYTSANNMSLEGFGQIKLDPNCTGGSISIRGNIRMGQANAAVTLVDSSRYETTQNVAGVTNPVSVSAYSNFPQVTVSAQTNHPVVSVSAYTNFPQVTVSANLDKINYTVSAQTNHPVVSVSAYTNFPQVTVSANLDKTNYTVSAGTITTVTGNVNGSVASVTNPVTVGTNNDKTNYTVSAWSNNFNPQVTVSAYNNFPQVTVSAQHNHPVVSVSAYSNFPQVTVSAQTNHPVVSVSAYTNFPQVTVSAINNSVISSATFTTNAITSAVFAQNAADTVWSSTLNKVGTPISIDGGVATVAGMLTKIFDDNGGAAYDATIDSLKSIASSVVASGPVATLATSASSIINGVLVSGTYTDTWTQNGTYWVISNSGTSGLDVRLNYSAGTGKLANQVRVIGSYRVASPVGTKAVDVYAFNYSTSGWDQISAPSTRINGTNTTTDSTYSFTLSVNNMNINGNAIIRFVANDTNNTSYLYIDYVPFYYQTGGSTIEDISQAVYNKMKYSVYGGAIWIDTISGTAGTEVGVNGLPGRPVNNLADAITLANAVGTKEFELYPYSSIVLSQNFESWKFKGHAIIDLNGKSINSSLFFDSHLISGTGLGSDSQFVDCDFGNITLSACDFHNCKFSDRVTLTNGSQYTVINGIDGVPGGLGLPTFVMAPSVSIGFREWKGGLQLDNMTSSCDVKVDGYGRLVITSACVGGDIVVRGFWTITDNVPGGFQGTITRTAMFNTSQPIGSVTNPVTVSAYSNFPQVTVSAITDGSITSADFATDYYTKVQSLTTSTFTIGQVQVSGINSNVFVGTSAYTNFPQVTVSAQNNHPVVSVSAYSNFPQVTVSAINSSVISSTTFASNAITSATFAQNAADTVWLTPTRSITTNLDKINYTVSAQTNHPVVSVSAYTNFPQVTVSAQHNHPVVSVSAYTNFPQVTVSAQTNHPVVSVSAYTNFPQVTVSANLDKTNYTVSAGTITTVTGNVNGSVNSVTNSVTVGTNLDKTNYTVSAWSNNFNPQVTVSAYNNFPQVTVSGTTVSLSADISSINGSTVAASNLSKSALVMVQGTISSATYAPTDQDFEATGMTEITTGHYNGRIIVFTSGNLMREVCEITNYDYLNSKGFFTVRTKTVDSHLIAAPVHGDTFIIV